MNESTRNDEIRRGLAPPQYRLSTLMNFTVLVALVLALSQVIGAYGTFWLIVFLLGVLGHIAGNALGRQLQGRGTDVVEGAFRPPVAASAGPRLGMRPPQLGRRRALGLWVYLGTAVGALASMVGGIVWLVAASPEGFHVGAALVALVAFGVLGGIWSFLTLGFLSITVVALRESLRSSAASAPAAVPAPSAAGPGASKQPRGSLKGDPDPTRSHVLE